MSSPLALILAASPSFAADPAANVTADLLAEVRFDQKITLISAGSGPKTVVRYVPEPGAAATYELKTRIGMDMSMTGPDGQPMSMPLGQMMPTTVLTMRHTVGQPVKNGMIPVKIEQTDVRVVDAAPEMLEVMKQSLEQTRGMAFQVLVDPATGRPVQLDVAPGTDPAIGQAIQGLADQMTQQMAMFPAEAIGRGAKWTTESDMNLSGMSMRAVQTSTVTAITPEALEMDVTTTMKIGQGPLQLPGMPPEAKVDITRFTGSGAGKMRVDLATLVTTGTVTMDVDMAMRIGGADAAMDMGMKMHQTTDMALVKAK